MGGKKREVLGGTPGKPRARKPTELENEVNDGGTARELKMEMWVWKT